MMRNFKYIWLVGIGVTLIIVAIPIALFASNDARAVDDPWQFIKERQPATDHSALISGELTTGADVTRTCLSCHEDAAFEVMQTTHWTWESEPMAAEDGDELVSTGKANLFNNFCIGVQSNWTGCTKCHAGYGWTDANFDFTNQENVDCLVCHDQSGTYVKAGGGQPAEGVDLLVAARSVTLPTRQNCGTCHFFGGGGEAVKHGDLDPSLYFPPETVDVHMGRYDFQCTTCHTTDDHSIQGKAMSVTIDNTQNQVACTDCHQPDVHDDDRINAHVENLACQTCHIPAGAVRIPTKMEWDWSTAGQDLPEDPHEYLKIKGSFVYDSNITPDYDWYNGKVDRYLMGGLLDEDGVTVLNDPLGDINDPAAKIWPFKIHFGQQPYDLEYNYLLQPKTVGEYWVNFDWDAAFKAGAEASGLDYSGQYGFAETVMYWNLSHMVTPKEYALQCTDCHGENTRMDWEALGYAGDPMTWGGR